MWRFYYSGFEKELWLFKVKESMHFVEQNIDFNKNETESKLENLTPSFRETNLVLQLIQESKIKSKTVVSWSLQKEKGHFLNRLFCPKEKFSTFMFYLNVKCIEYTFRIYILFHIKKHYFIHSSCLFLKSSKSFSVSLSILY